MVVGRSWQIALLIVAIAIAAALTARSRLPRLVLWTGITITIGVWIPLLSAFLGWAGDNPVGLGLLAYFGSDLGLLVIGCGVLLRLWEMVRS